MPTIDSVPWQHLTQPKYDEIVEALLIHHHQDLADGSRAEALDGRGGDGGRDVDVHIGENLDVLDTIYQLKYFPEGFSGGHAKSRKPQIRRSFEAAMKDSPRAWVLVLPRNVTKSERSWVRALAGKRKVRIEIWGQSQLNAELAKRPTLLAWATRDALVDTLKSIGQERAALVGPTDLSDRARNLHALADARSPFWGTAFTVSAQGRVTEALYPKVPDAHLKEPISFSFAINTDALDDNARTTAEVFRDYGIGTVQLPGEALIDFTTTGPQWLTIAPGPGDIIQLGPVPRKSEPVTLRTVDEDGSTIRAVRGYVTAFGRGRVGSGLSLACTGGLKVTFLLDDDRVGAQATIVQQFAGENATYVMASIELAESVPQAATVQVMRGPTPLLSLRSRPEMAVVDAIAPPYERQLVDDLAVIAAFARVPLDVPEQLTAHQRQEIRRLRLILDGHAVLEPAFGQLTTSLRPDVPEAELERFAGTFAVAVTAAVAYDVLGHVIRLKDSVIYHPRAFLTAPVSWCEVETARDRSKPVEVVITGGDHGSFWLYVPELSAPGERAALTPLQIPGLDEAPLPDFPSTSDPAA